MSISWLPETPDLLPEAVLVLVIVAVAWIWLRSDFVIRVRDGQVQCRGKIPAMRQPELVEFLIKDLGLRGPVRIAGRWQRGRLDLSFRGGLDKGQRQRVRNFLLTRLRGPRP
jgi:hypothetical protein